MSEETKKEIIEKEEKSLIETNQDLLTPDAIRKAEIQVDGINKIKEISLKLTNPSDWMVMNGKPCLQNSGCMKIANLWGVSFHSPVITEERRNDDKGEYILYTCAGEAEFRNRVVNDIGTSSTRDKLLGTMGGQLKPLSDVDLPSIKKMAMTNWQSRILKKILGLSFEMADLQKKNITPNSSVNHTSGFTGGGKISEAQKKRMFAIKHKSKSADDIKEYLKTVYNIEHSADIDKKDYEKICNWVQQQKEEISFDKVGE